MSSDKVITIEIPKTEEWSLKDLKSVCRHNRVKRYTAMNREQLIHEVQVILNKMREKKEIDEK